jgi:hypothetical protein
MILTNAEAMFKTPNQGSMGRMAARLSALKKSEITLITAISVHISKC